MQKVIGGILILSATAGAGVVYGNELKRYLQEHGLSAICIWTNQGGDRIYLRTSS